MKSGTAFAVVAALALFVLAAAAWGLLVMLLFGVLHHEISEAVPPIGFWPSLLIGVFLAALTGKGARR